MAPIGNAVFATLLINDGYLPGAMVLGHSLKDRGAKGKLVALVVIDRLAASTISELKTVWDDVVPVQQINNRAPANLYLMNRPDLISAFTKIQLWRQTQYDRIVYIDADVVALRAPNELLTLDTEFAAVPDIGWPDCFNSGVMVLNPNMADYYALLALAERGISFDGADQGLLNMHFTEWERLSFKYNCTPSGNYQYVPAYRHFQSSINLVHFIGREKPWTLGRESKYNTGVYGELLGRWWAVYDRHYRAREVVYTDQPQQVGTHKVQDYVTGEQTLYLPQSYAPPPPGPSPQQQESGLPSVVVHPPDGVPSASGEVPLGDQPSVEERISSKGYEPTPTVEQRRWSAPHAEWEPARAPPPVNAKPEASNFPSQIYDFSADTKLFQPPTSYPDAPKDMWYEVPAKPAPENKPKPIFPWELHAPKPTRVFPQPKLPSPPPEPQSLESTATPDSASQPLAQSQSAPSGEPQSVQHSQTGSESASPPHFDFKPEPQANQTTRATAGTENNTYTTGTGIVVPKEPWVNPWEAFKDRSNAWDDMPDIAAYVQSLQPPKRGKIQVLHHTPSTSVGAIGDLTSPVGSSGRRGSVKVTDFPTEIERPSLPVTPAPIRRPTFWGDESEMSGELPNAEGVPKQDEWVRRFSSYPTPAFAAVSPLVHERNGVLWCRCQQCGKQNPIARLEELQRRQSQALLGKENLAEVQEPPKRDLPESASIEDVEAAVIKATSPTSTRPLKPILKEPHFELGELPNNNATDEGTNSVHNAVTQDVLSPGDVTETRSDNPTPQTQVAA